METVILILLTLPVTILACLEFSDRCRARRKAMRAVRFPAKIGTLTRDQIVTEIRRTAEANGGTPLGRARFEAATGIYEHDWRGRFWARWSDALSEAGFAPNELQGRYDDELLLGKLVSEIRRLGRMPTMSELSLRRREDDTFPSASVFERFGPKATWASKVADYCESRADSADVAEIVARVESFSTSTLPLVVEEEGRTVSEDGAVFGFVYLLKSGRHYKIGHTLDVGRRRYDLAIQLPEPVTEEHAIRTDDPAGIERYWHVRFAARRKNGEWFELTRADVSAFKRRKFM